MAVLNNTQIQDRTEAINFVKPIPTLLGSLGFFREEFVGSDAITFDVKDNALFVLADQGRNTKDKNGNGIDKYDIHTMAIPHYPIESVVSRNQLAGLRGFGTDTETAIETAVANQLERQAQKHDYHEEYLKALMVMSGKIDTNFYGSIDMATEFGVTRPTATFDFTSPMEDFASKIRGQVEVSKANLKTGGFVRGYVMFCGAKFFEGLMTSASIKEAYAAGNSLMNPLRNELGEAAAGYTMFRFGNVDIIQYTDTFVAADGSVIKPLADDKAVLVPRTEMGSIFFGPVSKLSGVGVVGAKRFASSYRDPKDRYVEVESEQNTLPIISQFGATVLISGTFA